MSDPISDAGDVRVAISQYVRDTDTAMRDDVIEHVASGQGVERDRVERQLELSLKNGLLYEVNGEVRMP